jgi:hypothetical protein
MPVVLQFSPNPGRLPYKQDLLAGLLTFALDTIGYADLS